MQPLTQPAFITLPSLHPDLILERAPNGWAIVRLNRPRSLHALDESLCKAMYQAFETFAQDETVTAVWMDSTTPKAFCAGGDVRKLREMVVEQHAEQAEAFFTAEYQLDLLLHQYAKPIVIWGEGYVMGGGLGLFMAAPFRLVTPTSKLAMPEINIGLFPDVGGTRFLAERGRIGLFLALTGSIIGASGAYAIGWATHICRSERQTVLNALIDIPWQDHRSGSFRAIEDTLCALHRPLPVGPLQSSLDTIQSVCRGVDFMQDYQAVLDLRQAGSDWLQQAGENLASGSPTSAALSWLLWQWGKNNPSWERVFNLEKEVAAWKIRHADFSEGVRARLVDKDLNPEWQAATFTDLKSALNDTLVSQDAEWQDILKDFGVVQQG